MLQERIAQIEKEGREALQKAKTGAELTAWEVRYLGRKSELVTLLKGLKDLPPAERQTIGSLGNAAKDSLREVWRATQAALFEKSMDWESERIDVTAPGIPQRVGHLHLLSRLEYEISDIFASLGFALVEGPEVESEWYNFDALNVPADHPARDMQDTFWLASSEQSRRAGKSKGLKKQLPSLLLRTHTSPVQVRYMQTHKPPLRIIVPGKIFRSEATDASHEHTFFQFECLMVDHEVSVAHFKYIAQTFFEHFFEQKVRLRLRPSFFPFTEPSFEFDLSCVLCEGRGCMVCKQSGWLEIGGAGMVNQKVFEAAGYKRGVYQGFAWGFGLTRLAMMKYRISDIRLFLSGDLRFIRQF